MKNNDEQMNMAQLDQQMDMLKANLPPKQFAALQEIIEVGNQVGQGKATMADLNKVMDKNAGVLPPEFIDSMRQEMVKAQQAGGMGASQIGDVEQAKINSARAMLEQERAQGNISDKEFAASIERVNEYAAQVSGQGTPQGMEANYNASLGMNDANAAQRLDNIYANSPDTSMASERAQLAEEISQLSKQREQVLVERESISTGNKVVAGGIGGLGAAIAAKLLHGGFNTEAQFGDLVKKAEKVADSASKPSVYQDVSKLVDNTFKKAKDAEGFNVDLNGVKDALTDRAHQAFVSTDEGFVKSITSSLYRSVNGSGNVQLNDTIENVTQKIGETAKELIAIKEQDKFEQALDELSQSQAFDGIISGKGDYINHVKDNISKARDFRINGEEKKGLDNVKEAVADKIKTNKVGEFFNGLGDKFNDLGNDDKFIGSVTKKQAAQAGVILGITAVTAAAVIGIDHMLNAKNREEKEQLGNEADNLNSEINGRKEYYGKIAAQEQAMAMGNV